MHVYMCMCFYKHVHKKLTSGDIHANWSKNVISIRETMDNLISSLYFNASLIYDKYESFLYSEKKNVNITSVKTYKQTQTSTTTKYHSRNACPGKMCKLKSRQSFFKLVFSSVMWRRAGRDLGRLRSP